MRMFIKNVCSRSQYLLTSGGTTRGTYPLLSSQTFIHSTPSNPPDGQVDKSVDRQAPVTKSESEAPVTESDTGMLLETVNKAPYMKNLSKLKPAMKVKSCNLAAYVNQSETLTNLVKLGVNLSIVESNVDASNHLLKGDFKTDIEPYLQYLHHIGVPDSSVAKYITKNPALFLQSIDNLKSRVDYLATKKFDAKQIVDIVLKCPQFLNLTSKVVDDKLGFLQKQFSLTGDQVRSIVTRLPKLIVWGKASIKETKFVMKDICGFTKSEETQIIVALPKVYMLGRHALETRFSFIHNTLGFSHEQITSDPRPLRTRVQVLRSRHRFLKSLNRDQYDPEQANYVSLSRLASGRDSEFVQLVAKSTIRVYDAFLKTL